MTPLQQLHSHLQNLASIQRHACYFLPRLWIPPHKHAGVREIRCPAAFYAGIIESILKNPLPSSLPPLRENELFYLAFVRYTCAWDHDGSGIISYTPTADEWRQTGTFVKMIGLLPYIHSLGVTTIILLPITEHGRWHIKGTLGSPYAPRSHSSLEPTLAEPVIPMDVKDQFRAFIEASHRLGIRVVLELALRVAARDCPLIEQHPEWFYWVRVEGQSTDLLIPPTFSPHDLAQIDAMVKAGIYHDLPQPSAEYRVQFVDPPQIVRRTLNGGYIGTTSDGQLCIVPNAFADYPPNDPQPLWSDVTFFRLYNHPELNYIAYNTIRYYDQRLIGYEIQPLWDYIADVIPSWIVQVDIDGVLLDMGHAFPYQLHSTIVTRARSAKPGFILFEETFDPHDWIARTLNYDAVVGAVWHYARNIMQLRQYISTLHPSLPCFATPDTHNTPRIITSGIETTLYAFALCSCIPNTFPLITTGSEFGETQPINTGLDFSPHEQTHYPAEYLPLFSGCTLCWDSPNIPILEFIRAIYRNRPMANFVQTKS